MVRDSHAGGRGMWQPRTGSRAAISGFSTVGSSPFSACWDLLAEKLGRCVLASMPMEPSQPPESPQ